MSWQPVATAPFGRILKVRCRDGSEHRAQLVSSPTDEFPGGEWVVFGNGWKTHVVEWDELESGKGSAEVEGNLGSR